jgi:hypothetical protein
MELTAFRGMGEINASSARESRPKTGSRLSLEPFTWVSTGEFTVAQR